MSQSPFLGNRSGGGSVACAQTADSSPSCVIFWLNQMRQLRMGPDPIELNTHENSANKPADTAQDPHIGYVNRSR